MRRGAHCVNGHRRCTACFIVQRSSYGIQKSFFPNVRVVGHIVLLLSTKLSASVFWGWQKYTDCPLHNILTAFLLYTLEERAAVHPVEWCNLLLYGNNSFSSPSQYHHHNQYPSTTLCLPFAVYPQKWELNVAWGVGGGTDICGPLQPSLGSTASALLFSEMQITITEGEQGRHSQVEKGAKGRSIGGQLLFKKSVSGL